MATSVGTAWIQIKPTLKGISNDIKAALGDSGAAASANFGNKFKSSFLLSAKSSFKEAFTEFTSRSDAAFDRFKTTAGIGLAVVGAGVVAFARQLDAASGSQKTFTANMQLAGYTNEATSKTFNLLRDYADKSIYSLADMTATAGVLASTGVKNSGELVRAFGNLAAAADSPAQAIKSISQQMAQVNGKGFVQTMDFRIMQEQAAGPMKQVTDELMKLNNWDMKGFYDALSSGKISADMLNAAILKVGKNPVLEELATKPRTIGDAWEALTSSLVSNVSTTGSWAKIQQKAIDLLVKATDWIGKNQDSINKWIDGVVSATTSIVKFVAENKDWIILLAKVVAGYKALEIGVGAYRSAMDTLSPIYKLAKGAVEGSIGLVQTLTGKFKSMGDSAGGIVKAKDGIDGLSTSVNKAPKTFTFGDSITSFFKNIGKVLSGAVDAIMKPLKSLADGLGKVLISVLESAGKALAAFFGAFSNPKILVGILIATVAMASAALSILMIGGAIGAVAPGLGDFMDKVLLPMGEFLRDTFVVAIREVTMAIIALTNGAVIPLVNAVSGGLTQAFSAIGGVIEKAGKAVSGVVDSIANGIANVIDSISNLLSSAGKQDWYGTGYGITRNFSAGLIDGLIDLLQDGLNRIIGGLVNIPGIGKALQSAGLKAGSVDLSKFKLGRRADGGPVWGPGGPKSDSIPMALSNGEYVIQAAAARRLGYGNLDRLNATGELGSGGDTYNIYPPAEFAGDYQTLAQWISKYISLQKKRVMA